MAIRVDPSSTRSQGSSLPGRAAPPAPLPLHHLISAGSLPYAARPCPPHQPPQQGTEDYLLLLCDPDEEVLVEAIIAELGMRWVGFIFTQAMGAKGEFTMSTQGVLQAAELQVEGGIEEWVTTVPG